jgi:tRNA nucleotidyltransferase/poly(A) polymerase
VSKKKPKAPKRPTGSKPTPSLKASTTTADSRSKWIPTDKNLALPSSVKDAVSRLGAADFTAYLVGGAVRDFLLGLPVKDYDLATDATPDEVAEIFPNAIPVGKAFGVMKVPYPVEGGLTEVVEIATFREDAEYTDFRHPKSVRFSGPEADAQRRDFTIN